MKKSRNQTWKSNLNRYSDEKVKHYKKISYGLRQMYIYNEYKKFIHDRKRNKKYVIKKKNKFVKKDLKIRVDQNKI